MRSSYLKSSLLVALVVVASMSSSSARAVAVTGQGATLTSIGPLAFGPDGTLFAADNQAAAIYAFDLGAQAAAARRGEGARRPRSEARGPARHGGSRDLDYRSRRAPAHAERLRVGDARPGRGRGAGALPRRRRRQDRDGVARDGQVPEGGAARMRRSPMPRGRRNPRVGIRHRPRVRRRQGYGWRVSRTRSSRRSCAPCPIRSTRSTAARAWRSTTATTATLETRSPVYAFVPHTINGQAHLVAGYLCTPLVKFPIDSLKPGEKVRGIDGGRARRGEPAARHDPVQEGRQGLPADVQQQPRRDEDPGRPTSPRPRRSRRRWTHRRAACGYQTIASMQGIEQLDLLDAQSSIVIARANGALNLQVFRCRERSCGARRGAGEPARCRHGVRPSFHRRIRLEPVHPPGDARRRSRARRGDGARGGRTRSAPARRLHRGGMVRAPPGVGGRRCPGDSRCLRRCRRRACGSPPRFRSTLDGHTKFDSTRPGSRERRGPPRP